MLGAAKILAEIASYVALAQSAKDVAVTGISMVENIAKLFGAKAEDVTQESLEQLIAERRLLASQIDEDIPPEVEG